MKEKKNSPSLPLHATSTRRRAALVAAAREGTLTMKVGRALSASAVRRRGVGGRASLAHFRSGERVSWPAPFTVSPKRRSRPTATTTSEGASERAGKSVRLSPIVLSFFGMRLYWLSWLDGAGRGETCLRWVEVWVLRRWQVVRRCFIVFLWGESNNLYGDILLPCLW